jgi:hypothetical protein
METNSTAQETLTMEKFLSIVDEINADDLKRQQALQEALSRAGIDVDLSTHTVMVGMDLECLAVHPEITCSKLLGPNQVILLPTPKSYFDDIFDAGGSIGW